MNYYVGMRLYHKHGVIIGNNIYEVTALESSGIQVCLEDTEGNKYYPKYYGFDVFTIENGWRVVLDMDKELEWL